VTDNWKPVDETTPKHRRLLFGWKPRGNRGETTVIAGQWDDDRHAIKPRPFWTHDRERFWGKVTCREQPPDYWMELPELPS